MKIHFYEFTLPPVIGDDLACSGGRVVSLDEDNNFAKCVILVNLNKTLLVDLWYLQLFLGDDKFQKTVKLITDVNDIGSLADTIANNDTQIIAIQASNHELLKNFPIDLAINIASMQEMEPQYIRNYFDGLYTISSSRDLDFYCCNREEKTLPDGTITRFKDYPWSNLDNVKIDELCPWHQQFYIPYPPFYKPYDGPHRHQLRTLTKNRYE